MPIRGNRLFLAVISVALAWAARAAQPGPQVSIVMSSAAPMPAKFAMEQVRAELDRRKARTEEAKTLEAARGDTVLVVGLADGPPAFAEAVRALGIELPKEPESLLIRRATYKGKRLIVVSGGDALGLAYALNDIADRIAWEMPGTDPLGEVRDALERPAVRDRSVSTYTMQQAWFESRLFDTGYWAKYFDSLVRNRFNNFSLLLGYESSGYLAPPYAWFFDLPQFPEVKAAGVTREQQERYVRALNRVIEMAHERGLRFTLGIWDHIYDGHSSYYTEGVWDRLPEVNGRKPRWPVEGLAEKNLAPYTQAALRRFLELVPNLDAIQFRMHGESGLNAVGLRNFWEPIFRIMARKHPKIRVDARAKEFPRDLIDLALQMGVPLRLTTKYMAEQMGMPFHPMHLQRADQFGTRLSYFDMLRYPQTYKVQWRLWSSGTSRLLLWGDPEYARRFVESTHLYDGDGFEVSEPSATKMASQPHDLAPIPILNPQYRYYEYEFERYWPFFQMYGRLSYNPATASEVRDRQFELHFGKEAGPSIERALNRASWILPRIVAYCLPPDKFPTTRGWPERQRWEDLPDYAKAEPADTQLFASFQEEARNLLAGEGTPKIRPEETSLWFDGAAADVLQQVAEAERLAGTSAGKEFRSATTDLKILAHLAEYHARRIHAGIQYALFQQSGDLWALDAAIGWERQAIDRWEALVATAGDVYRDNLAMGLPESKDRERPANDLAGHWRDEIPKLRRGLEALETQRAAYRPALRRGAAKYDFGHGPLAEGYQRLPLKRDVTLNLPSGWYELQFTVRDGSARPSDCGPMWIEANGSARTDAFAVRAGETATRTLQAEAIGGKINLMFDAATGARWTVSRLVATQVGPSIAHIPVRTFRQGEALRLRATAAGENGIRAVRVSFGDSMRGYSTRGMRRTGPLEYEIELPAAELREGAGYFIEAEDTDGRVTDIPREGAAGLIAIAAERPPETPSLRHNPVATARAGAPLRVMAEVTAPSGVRWVRLRYRSVNQRQDYRTLTMLLTGSGNQYAAEIPGSHILADWDFMYYFEVMDNRGNGKIFPDANVETPYTVVKLDRAAQAAAQRNNMGANSLR